MQTLMCHYFRGENMASRRKATCSVSISETFKQESQATYINCVDMLIILNTGTDTFCFVESFSCWAVACYSNAYTFAKQRGHTTH